LSGRDGLLDGSVSSDFFAVCGAAATENKWDGTETIPPWKITAAVLLRFGNELEWPACDPLLEFWPNSKPLWAI